VQDTTAIIQDLSGKHVIGVVENGKTSRSYDGSSKGVQDRRI